MRGSLPKWTPTLVGLLLLYSGIYKLIHPGEAIMALVVLGFTRAVADAVIIAVTMVELYLGVVLAARLDLKYTLGVATGLMFVFTAFLCYLSLLAHPPACGCMGFMHVFLSNRHNALAGMVRNVIILWLLKCAYDYYVKALAKGGQSRTTAHIAEGISCKAEA
jgi:hypothetical protein